MTLKKSRRSAISHAGLRRFIVPVLYRKSPSQGNTGVSACIESDIIAMPLDKLPIKISPGLGLSMIDRAIKESFALRCSAAELENVRQYFSKDGCICCLYCGAPNPSRWDHLHAVSRGGDTAPGNLVPACQRCDDSKQDKDIDEWLSGKSKHRPDLNSLARIQSEVKAYQAYFSHEPKEFDSKLTEPQRATYARFRKEIDSLRAHLKQEGLLK